MNAALHQTAAVKLEASHRGANHAFYSRADMPLPPLLLLLLLLQCMVLLTRTLICK
jgi:hypothetical protein